MASDESWIARALADLKAELKEEREARNVIDARVRKLEDRQNIVWGMGIVIGSGGTLLGASVPQLIAHLFK